MLFNRSMLVNEIASIVKNKVSTSELTLDNYISTDNMLPNYSGIQPSTVLPAGKATAFCPEDILLSNIRPYFRKIWFSNMHGGCNADIICLRVNSKRCVPQYLYYQLLTDNFINNYVKSCKGAKMPRGDVNKLLEYDFYCPEYEEQLRITNILGTLDKRLELCRKITASLLKQLDELYDYYFGDVNKAKQNRFGHDFFEILSGYPFDSSTYSKGKYKIITIKSIKMNDFDTLATDCVESIPSSIDAECILSCGDILISLTGDTGRIAVVDEKDCLLNQRVGKILCEDKYKIYSYALLRSPYAQRYISKNSVGTSQKNISPIILSDIKTYLPDEDELKNFNTLAVPLFQKYVAEQKRAKNMIQIKNIILPLLMNGQVQVMN